MWLLIGVQMLFHGFRNDEVFKYIAELGMRNQCFDRPNAQEMTQQASVIKIEGLSLFGVGGSVRW